MRKIALTLTLLLAAFATNAQSVDNTYQFTKQDGTVIPNGTTINVTTTEFDAEDNYLFATVHPDLYLKNTTDNGDKKVRIHWDIEKINTGRVSFCFPENCFIGTAVGKNVCTATALAAGATTEIDTHWETEAYGDCEVKYSIEIVDANGTTHIANGPSVLVRYYLSDPASSINGVSKEKVTEVARYTVEGKRLSKPVKGLNIIKMSDGTVIKKIEK